MRLRLSSFKNGQADPQVDALVKIRGAVVSHCQDHPVILEPGGRETSLTSKGWIMSGLARGDQRQFGRRQTHMHAWISVPGRPKRACIVCNLSQAGALLIFADVPLGLPYCFKLEIEPIGFETACEIRHQRGTRRDVGVEFVSWTALTDHLRNAALQLAHEWDGQ
jgi:hypothetical protein